MNTVRWLTLCAALCLAACLFDKAPAEVDLTLTRLPAGTDRVIVKAVDKSDTSIVIEERLFSGAYTPGMTLHFALRGVQGRESNTLLRVEGYRDSLLVYLSLIPPAKNSTEEVLFPDVTQGWPSIAFTSIAKDADTYPLGFAIRGAPAGTLWRLSPNVPKPNQTKFVRSGDGFRLGGTLMPGTWITVELVKSDSVTPLAVQVPDSLLTDELLAPSGATVEIQDAKRVVNSSLDEDSVHITLNVGKFTAPSVDEPVPGRGWPKVLDARGLRPIPDFKVVDEDVTRLVGPSWRLGGVSKIVVALHYANGQRVRPLIADTIDAATALVDRGSLPKVEIASTETVAGGIRFTFTQTNFADGMHVHVYKDQVDAPTYKLCPASVCTVGPDVTTGAARLIAVVVDRDHNIYVPQSRDTLLAPF